MKVRVITSLVMALCLTASVASAQSIGVYFDPAGASCSGTVAAFTPVTWYILALLGGPSVGGITGAEFRQDGTPVGWFMTPTASPASNVTVGSPLTGGCNIAFPGCQPGVGGVVLLYTVSGFATSLVGPTYLSIKKHTVPTDPSFQCPTHVLCDAPNYTTVCAVGGQAIINGGPCTVGVEAKSWSGVKALYN